MPAPVPLYQTLLTKLVALSAGRGVRLTSLRRLALLVTGIIDARSCVVAQVAHYLLAQGLTGASSDESIARRLRRTLADRGLEAGVCYEPLLAQVVDWGALAGIKAQVVIAVDETTRQDRTHLLRASLAYWGGAIPLTWTTWAQNVALAPGAYWEAVDGVFGRLRALLPGGLSVVILADRAYDIPAFVDRVGALGWHWVVRCKAKSSLRFRDRCGREWALKDIIGQRVGQAGQRWKARGWVFKDAGWRQASVVAVWGQGEKEALVVLSDLAPGWEVLRLYRRRAWTECGFRSDKSKGWGWEQSQVQSLGHQERLLLAMAWASLVVYCVGVAEATAHRVRAGRAKPQHARLSVFTMGLRRSQRWLRQGLPTDMTWHLPDIDARAWTDQWYSFLSFQFIFTTVRP